MSDGGQGPVSGALAIDLEGELRRLRAEVEAALGAEVLGQEAACRTAADVVLTFKAGLNDPSRLPATSHMRVCALG